MKLSAKRAVQIGDEIMSVEVCYEPDSSRLSDESILRMLKQMIHINESGEIRKAELRIKNCEVKK